MAENSKIEWTDHTFNPWIGCTKISPACDGCYAENLMATRMKVAQWGAGEPRKRTSVSNWQKPIAWNKQAIKSSQKTYVFCASLADVFDNEVPDQWRYDLFDLIEITPNLTWLLLTKRIGNVLKMTDISLGHKDLPKNVYIGATIANQEEYDRDSHKLLKVKQTKNITTFSSMEPLLGEIKINKNASDWIITGGETSQGKHKARYADPDWFRNLRDKSLQLNRAFFMKQMSNKEEIPSDLHVREWPNN